MLDSKESKGHNHNSNSETYVIQIQRVRVTLHNLREEIRFIAVDKQKLRRKMKSAETMSDVRAMLVTMQGLEDTWSELTFKSFSAINKLNDLEIRLDHKLLHDIEPNY